MVAIQIFSETDADVVARLLSKICGYEISVGRLHELPSTTNRASFVLGTDTRVKQTTYTDYKPRSHIAMDVYNYGHTEQAPIGNDLKLKIRQLWEQLERPVAFHTADICSERDNPLSIDDL